MVRHRKFRLITVPAELHSQIRYHERLLLKLGAATDPDEIQTLYSELCYARFHLYSYLEVHCEKPWKNEATVSLRFL